MRNFILIIIAGISISASAQINFNNDTIDLVINESAEILNEAKAIIKIMTTLSLEMILKVQMDGSFNFAIVMAV